MCIVKFVVPNDFDVLVFLVVTISGGQKISDKKKLRQGNKSIKLSFKLQQNNKNICCQHSVTKPFSLQSI